MTANWEIICDEVDSRNGTRQFDIVADDPTDPGYQLLVGYYGGQLQLVVNWLKTKVSDYEEIPVSWQIDNGLVRKQLWDVSKDGTQTYMPDVDVRGAIRGLSIAEWFSVWVSPSELAVSRRQSNYC